MGEKGEMEKGREREWEREMEKGRMEKGGRGSGRERDCEIARREETGCFCLHDMICIGTYAYYTCARVCVHNKSEYTQ